MGSALLRADLLRRLDIDGLRAIAILAVVLYHIDHDLLPGGYVGVDVFFVISGFLITGLVKREQALGVFSILDFYARRVKRLAPALALVLLVTMAVSVFVLFPRDLMLLGRHTAAACLFVLNFVLSHESGYFSAPAETKPLLHLWSLAIEEQFYLVWPVALWLTARVGGRPTRTAFAVLTVVASSLACLATLRVDPVGAFYLPWTRVWELAAGGVLALVVGRVGTVRSGAVSAALSWCGLSMLVAGFSSIGQSHTSLSGTSILAVVGATMLIGAGAESWLNRVVLSSRPMVAVGLISYPLYLWHWPMLAGAAVTGAPLWTRWAFAGIAVLLAAATYLVVELRVTRAYVRASRKVVVALSALMATVTLMGVALEQTHGLAFLYPPAFLQYDGYVYRPAHHRVGPCHLDLARKDHELAPTCLKPRGDAPHDRPVLLLWGDSHAAHLFPALATLQDKTPFDIAQVTAGMCPPLRAAMSGSAPQCPTLHALVRDKLDTLRPDVVVLGARWPRFDAPESRAAMVAELTELRDALAAMGTRLIVVGPEPQWTAPLPELLADRVWATGQVPVRLGVGEGLDADVLVIRDQLAEIGADAGVHLVQPVDLMCEAGACRAVMDDAARTPFSFDFEHVTDVGGAPIARAVLQRAGIVPPPSP
jgi:peptidoglycan/LPS O-acetylase OafA/YrhL